ncbi:unnamed protein product [Prorocentrum cordatum]|uniref:Uncharacterized protein n=1 Tax=Prorocentrum cordatum TaxID=2364126 RepID=A0ABN9PWF5_9DINO|nr:unnamed protein product [Polarella glacialis]
MNCMSNLFALPKCLLSSVDLMAATVVLLAILPLWLACRFLKNVSLLLGFPLTLLLVPALIGTRLLPKLSRHCSSSRTRRCCRRGRTSSCPCPSWPAWRRR